MRWWVLPVLVVMMIPVSASADDKEPTKVQVLVKSWLVPLSLASDLKNGKKISKVEILEGAPAKIDLTEVTKGKDEIPKTGAYLAQKIRVHKGNKFDTHDFYLSHPLPAGTKLKNFTYKGYFTGTIGGDPHKLTYFEATVERP